MTASLRASLQTTPTYTENRNHFLSQLQCCQNEKKQNNKSLVEGQISSKVANTVKATEYQCKIKSETYIMDKCLLAAFKAHGTVITVMAYSRSHLLLRFGKSFSSQVILIMQQHCCHQRRLLNLNHTS